MGRSGARRGVSRRHARWAPSRHEILRLLVVAFVVLAARSSLADHYVIPTGSMEHTIEIGDHVLVDKLAYGARLPFTGWRLTRGEAPARGEVVIFDSPVDGTRLIKRVVGVGGDLVRLRNGELLIDGRSQRAPNRGGIERINGHEAHLNLVHGGGADVPSLRVPGGLLLVVGDARGNSLDGRSFGLIPGEIVYGKATGIIYRRSEGLVWRGL